MLGDIIKEAREKALLSQSDLAKKSNIDVSTIMKLEKNQIKPSLTILRRLKEVLPLDGTTLRQEAGYVSNFDTTDDTFAAKVQRARLERLLSPSELATMCGVTYKTITNLESGKTKVVIHHTYRALCDFLDLK